MKNAPLPSLSHVDAANRPAMVDVSGKAVTLRTASARARVQLPLAIRARIVDGDIATAKGPVFQTAIIAGTMGAKRTHDLIPFCHPLGLSGCRIDIAVDEAGDVVIECHVRVENRTGVEMEALTGATVAALTVYDMCKALSHDIVIADVRLLAKTGGKSDYAAPAT
ncbi:MAG: cyclic pyranopterin monophosphate synthase MoaC [Chromatiales bacterium]|nr:cyclic pyranopterin monophosphate synthase MoaC [Chromatiales bacterium]